MTRREHIIRVLLGKPGLDGHDRGIKILAQALTDDGIEVIYSGLHQSVAQIVTTAVQEDVDLIGVSILSGAHMVLVPQILDELRARGAGATKLVVGGFIPEGEDRARLKELGAAEVFDQDVPLAVMVAAIRTIAG
ncbi:MAG TPA: methylmalonyl-CoA mutase [Chloroflexi bacterium]|jgi:methylmalonyl-CoA mutase C-terminal domain/subunit|nr:methylmalonyl-CoA mutase [Chloroflexota bacterium]